jgi:hypothetical protein
MNISSNTKVADTHLISAAPALNRNFHAAPAQSPYEQAKNVLKIKEN